MAPGYADLTGTRHPLVEASFITSGRYGLMGSMTTPTEDSSKDAPQGDPKRQAVDSLRGYAYQVTAAALAWLGLGEDERLYLEVAEDYTTIADDALAAVQVRDTAASGTVTLHSEGVRNALASFVDLVNRNPTFHVQLHYLTTSEIGQEKAIAERPAGEAGLAYWRRASAEGDIAPLRAILEGEVFPEMVRAFVRARDDDAIRADLLRRVHWDCGRPNLAELRTEFESSLIVVCRDRFGLPTSEARALADALVHCVLLKATAKEGAARLLTRADLYSAIDSAARISMPHKAVEDLLAKASSALACKDWLPPLLLENLALRFGFSHPGAEPDELAAFLRAKSDEFAALQARFAQIQGIEGAVETLVTSARAALEAGNFQLADRRLQEAEELQLTSATLAAVTKQSELRVARAQVALLSGDVGLAAVHWAAAAGYFSAFDRDREAETRSGACDELRGYGYRYRSIPALLAAEAALLINQEIWTRKANFVGWCRTTNALGGTRWRLAQFDEARFQQHMTAAEDAFEAVRSACSKSPSGKFIR